MESIKELKKYDLHCHLDGSLSSVTIRKLADLIGKELGDDISLRKSLQAEENCESLKEYLTRFELPLSCLVTEENFKLAAEELLQDAAKENVVYMEVRFAPLLSVRGDLSCRRIIESVLDGLKAGKVRCGVESRLIICGMRHMSPEVNVELVKTAAEYLGEGVAAVDLAGDEAAYPVLLHRDMFIEAKRLGIPYTIHAGECGSTQSIWDALELGASRIGHGIAAGKDESLVNALRERRIPLEMCPISNMQTKAVDSMEHYPFMDFMEAGLKVTINTDNRTVSDTTITKELELLKKQYHITLSEMALLMENAREAAFCNLR